MSDVWRYYFSYGPRRRFPRVRFRRGVSHVAVFHALQNKKRLFKYYSNPNPNEKVRVRVFFRRETLRFLQVIFTHCSRNWLANSDCETACHPVLSSRADGRRTKHCFAAGAAMSSERPSRERPYLGMPRQLVLVNCEFAECGKRQRVKCGNVCGKFPHFTRLRVIQLFACQLVFMHKTIYNNCWFVGKLFSTC